MKVAFEVKNPSKAIRPTKDDVLYFDGSGWYVTTKEDLLKDAYKVIEECHREMARFEEEMNSKLADSKQEIQDLKDSNANFKKEVAVQIKKLSELVEKLYTNSEVN